MREKESAHAILTVDSDGPVGFASWILRHTLILTEILVVHVEYGQPHVYLESGRAGNILGAVLFAVVKHLRVASGPVVQRGRMSLGEAFQSNVVASRYAYQLVRDEELGWNCEQTENAERIHIRLLFSLTLTRCGSYNDDNCRRSCRRIN